MKQTKPKRGRPAKVVAKKAVVKNKVEVKPKRGRPKFDFTKEKQDEILKRLAKGEPLLLIISDKGMPSDGYFYTYLFNNKTFMSRYREAKTVQAHSYADKSLLTVLSTHGRVKKRTAEKNEVQSAKNVADEYKFQAAKLAPKFYGKLAELQNEDGEIDNERIIKITSFLDGK